MEKKFKKYLELARLCDKQGKYNEALAYCQKLHKLKPESIEKALLSGEILLKLGKKAEAYNLALSVLKREEDHPDALLIIAKIYWDQGKLEESKQLCLKIIDKNPTYAEGFALLGMISKAQGKVIEALELYKFAIKNQPDNAYYYYNIGNAFSHLNMWKEAEFAYRECIRLLPKFHLGYQNLGRLLDNQNRQEEAVKYYKHAISLAPNELINRFNLAQSLLQSGHLQEGFQEYEKRLQWRADDYTYTKMIPQWHGGSFKDKRLLVFCEQGFGDCIQFIRYIPKVKELGGLVSLWCTEPLYRLFKDFKGVDEIVTGEKNLKNYDYGVPLLSLPHLLKTTLDSIPSEVPYITVNPAIVQKWEKRVDHLKSIKVGIVWGAKPQPFPEKSIPFEEFQSLIRIPGVSFVSLQKGQSIEEALSSSNLLDFGPYLDDFLETAGAISNLDIIITVDTAVAHLAGALGKQTFLLLPFKSEWRWLTKISISPWYPTMRLFRQQSPGNWSDVIAEVISFLQLAVKE
jgi:tetratricopeptide (TPR) repeat protein